MFNKYLGCPILQRGHGRIVCVRLALLNIIWSISGSGISLRGGPVKAMAFFLFFSNPVRLFLSYSYPLLHTCQKVDYIMEIYFHFNQSNQLLSIIFLCQSSFSLLVQRERAKERQPSSQ